MAATKAGLLSYVLVLLLAIVTASVVVFDAGFSIYSTLHGDPVFSRTLSPFYAAFSAVGLLALLCGLFTILSSRPLFTQIAGFGACTIALVSVAMVTEALWRGKQTSGLTFTSPHVTYFVPLSSWIVYPLLFNLGLLLLAQIRAAELSANLR